MIRSIKLWWHKLVHWEYWSANVVYSPTFILWVFNSLKFKKFTFYKKANPAMKNGGLYGDSKYKTYTFLKKEHFPKTIYIERSGSHNYTDLLTLAGLKYPLIVKPDTGFRGIGVEKVFSLEQLQDYGIKLKRNFLIQEIVEFPNELGLFYYRLPNSNRGKITGLTMKKFLTVIGDGTSTIEQLLTKTPRYAMQIKSLKRKMDLGEVLMKGEIRCLVPFGNHNRGTEFLDGSHLITEDLVDTFDDLLKNIPGFYYGRLDIRYNTLKELEQGINFSIIEINGAKSEPTHIYDQKYSFWKAQKEIFRHQRIFAHIVEMNLKVDNDSNVKLTSHFV